MLLVLATEFVSILRDRDDEREREIGRLTEIESERDRQRERERERERGRLTDTELERQAERETERDRER